MNVALTLAFGVVLGCVLGWFLARLRTRHAASNATPRPISLAEDDGHPVSLTLFDVDDLGGVNRENDFDTGDRLLDATADILRRALPNGAAVERLDSGRFLVWSPGTDLEQTTKMAETLRNYAGCSQVVGTNGLVARTLSAGVVASMPHESRARSILRADLALTRAKRAGGDRVYTLSAEPTPTLIPSSAAMNEAMETGAIEYYVQPIVRLSDRMPIGMEHLLRWNRPDGSVTGPAGFLDSITRMPSEGADLFPALAADAARAFVEAGTPIYAAFNVTAAVIDGSQGRAYRWLEQILELLPADQLVLEIVETSMIVAPEQTREMLQSLRARGVRIALDDFGTGLSNLERLRAFPIDIVKIDRCFVDGLGISGREEAILTAMTQMAHSLDLDLIAEGIETEAQARILIDLGVKYGQGYHLGCPQPASTWQKRLADGP